MSYREKQAKKVKLRETPNLEESSVEVPLFQNPPPALGPTYSQTLPSDFPQLDERYEVLEAIGEGGMGKVWRVRDKALDKTLAIKVLRKELAKDKFAVKRFEQEAEASARLTHANSVAIYGHGLTKDNSPYLIMDFIEGQSLDVILESQVYVDSTQALNIISQICEALAHAHSKGIIHRDLKPSNIILNTNSNGTTLVKIVDFGIAKVMPTLPEQSNNLTKTGDILGSPLYMSPEQCRGEALDARSDIYSVGCVLFELITGHSLFAAENPIKVILKQLEEHPNLPHELKGKNLPLGIVEILERCLEKHPQDRYQSITELQTDIELIKSGRPIASIDLGMLGTRIGGILIDSLLLGLLYSLVTASVLLMVQACHSPAELPAYFFGMIGNYFSKSFILGFAALGLADTIFPLCCPLLFLVYSIGLMRVSIPNFIPPDTNNSSNYIFEMITHPIVLSWILSGIFGLSNWIFHVSFETSQLKGTPGTLFSRTAIVNKNREHISTIQSTIRLYARALVFLLVPDLIRVILHYRKTKNLGTSIMYVLKRPIHDKLSGCHLIKRRK